METTAPSKAVPYRILRIRFVKPEKELQWRLQVNSVNFTLPARNPRKDRLKPKGPNPVTNVGAPQSWKSTHGPLEVGVL